MDCHDVVFLVGNQLPLSFLFSEIFLRASASNAARVYNTTLAQTHLFPSEWQFKPALSGYHVQDGFIIKALLEDPQCNNTVLDVQHVGNQRGMI